MGPRVPPIGKGVSLTHPTILAALASLRLAIRAAQRARRALCLLALVGVGGCEEQERARCERFGAATEHQVKFDSAAGCLVRCPSGLVLIRAFADYGCNGSASK